MAQSAASCVELHICSEMKCLKSKQEKSSKKKPKAAQKVDEPSFWSVLENWKSRRKYASFCDLMIQKMKKKKKNPDVECQGKSDCRAQQEDGQQSFMPPLWIDIPLRML